MLKVTFVFDNEYTIATTLLQTLKYSFLQKKHRFPAERGDREISCGIYCRYSS